MKKNFLNILLAVLLVIHILDGWPKTILGWINIGCKVLEVLHRQRYTYFTNPVERRIRNGNLSYDKYIVRPLRFFS